MSAEERAKVRRAGAEDARRSRIEQGLPERIEDATAIAILAALLRAARPPPESKLPATKSNQRRRLHERERLRNPPRPLSRVLLREFRNASRILYAGAWLLA
jgi:hypothetical protein